MLKMERFTKRIVPECRRATRSFQGRGGFVELGYFDKHFIKSASKNYTTTFLMKKLTQIWTQSGPFCQDQSTFFDFHKRLVEACPPNYAPVSVDMHHYLLISLNILENDCIMFWLCQDSEYFWASCIFNGLFKMPRF